MSPTKSHLPSIYNPGEQTREELISNFVIRLREFEELYASIKQDKMKKPPQHFIIQGQRGYGKTTLLLRLYYEIEQDKELNSWLIPVLFDEEQYYLRTIADLWIDIAEYLENESEAFLGLKDMIEEILGPDFDEEKAYRLLIDALHKSQKKVVVLWDNFGQSISKFSRKEKQRLREILITCNSIRIIGASTVVMEFNYDYSEPFFEFFNVIHLDELSHEETISLLKKLGETYKAQEIDRIIESQPGRIEALRRLTSGVPRTIVLFFEIFIDNEEGNSFKDLESLLDKVTPLYKHRMDDFSSQQQAIVDAIAMNWDAVSAKDIGKKIRMPSKAVSSQLNLLEKNQIIRKIPTSTKNHLYQVSERFFNIWYLMRYGKKKKKNKVRWLVEFLELWCTKEELIKRTKLHIDAVRKGGIQEKHAFYMSQALAKTSIPYGLQDALIKETRQFLSLKKSELLYELDKSKKEIFEEAVRDVKNNNEKAAIYKLTQADYSKSDIYFILGATYRREMNDIIKAKYYYLLAIESGNYKAMNNLAVLYKNQYKDYKKAEEYYLMAVEKGYSGAMADLAFLYQTEYKDYEKAEKYYLMAVEKGDSDAMNNLAILYENQYKDHKKAEEYFLMAVKKGYSGAMFNLALLYQTEHKDYEGAEKYYLMAVEKGYSGAMADLAFLYQTEHKDYEKAEKYYLMAVEKGHSGAMANLALLYQTEYKDYEKAEKYYLMALEKGHLGAMFNLALLYQTEYKDHEKAEKYYLMAAEKGLSFALHNLAFLYQTEYKDYERAERYYLKAVEKGTSRAMNNLALLYYQTRVNKTKALELAKISFEKEKDAYSAHTYSLILLWNNEVEKAVEISKIFVEDIKMFEGFPEDIRLFLIMLMAKKQYNYVYNLFEENKFEIKDRYKPIYYALMYFLQDKYPDEFKKMGDELRQTVMEIVEEVKRIEKDYA
jgi:TPR repeat protein